MTDRRVGTGGFRVSGLRLAGRLAAVIGTSYFLIATSAPQEPNVPPQSNSQVVCYHAFLSVSFHVTGTCGPEGDVTLTSEADDCTLAVQGGGAVGLPSAGRFMDGDAVTLTTDRWTLSGYLPEGAVVVKADAGFFTVERDAQASFTADGTRDSGGTGVQAPGASHGTLVARDCANSYDQPLTLLCRDGSAAPCQAVLVPRP